MGSADGTSDYDSLLTEVNELAAAYKSNPSEVSRLEFRAATLALNRALESIPEAVFRVNWGPVTSTAVRVAIEDSWLEHVVAAPSGSITADELCKKISAEKGLLTRMMRALIAEDLVKEVGIDTYGCTPVTAAFTIPGLRAASIHAFDNVNLSLYGLPQYLRNTKYKDPQDDTLGPYVVAHGKQFFTQLHEEPERRKIFDTFMSAQKQGRGGAGGWLDVFPIEERLAKPQSPAGVSAPEAGSRESEIFPVRTTILEKADPQQSSDAETVSTEAYKIRKADAKPDVALPTLTASTNGQLSAEEIIIIDMGGGSGHELLEFRKRYPISAAPGKVILQDLPDAVDHLDLNDLTSKGIEVMQHDFFTPQPVKGAQFYYMASVIHDWSNEDSLRILRNIIPAMKINHSSIIVVDLVVPEEKVPWWAAMLDITLLAIMCGKQRSKKELSDLVERAGLRVRKDGVYMLPTGEGATEIVLKDDERE